MATSTNAQLLAMTGLRNPYPGKLGVVEAGAFADLLLVDGDRLADLDLVADPANFDVIMKDGRIYKNSVGGLSTAAAPSHPPVVSAARPRRPWRA